MREIKFRGKKKNGTWLFGDFVQRPPIALIFPLDAPDSQDNYIVDLKTVGQFTGLTDKNGKRIFEGDIVKPNIKYITRNCQVVFDSLCYKLATKEWTNWFSELVWSDLEVIGNIYENPELLR